MMAALASAALPSLAVSGVRASDQENTTNQALGIDQAMLQDAAGRLYDVYASSTAAGRLRLDGRTRAARALSQAREPAALGFALDTVLAYQDGLNDRAYPLHAGQGDQDRAQLEATRRKAALALGQDAEPAVMLASHVNGQSRPLDLLTLDDCASVGTAIGAIHRMNPRFLQAAGYPGFSAGQIRSQLTGWIKRLRQAGHVPQSIINSWASIIDTEGLWSFSTSLVHGGFADGDMLFSEATVTAVTNWQDMQVNDPARDLAWLFAKLDTDHRNAVLSAYGRMLGSRLDDLIMLRANLWLQMEQVGEFIQALNHADNSKIMQFKAQVERLAHQLELATRRSSGRGQQGEGSVHQSIGKPPSTITVGTLLNQEDNLAQQSGEPSAQATKQQNGGSQASIQDHAEALDATGESDRTGSAQIKSLGTLDSDSTADRPIQSGAGSPAASIPVTAIPILKRTPEQHEGSKTQKAEDSVEPLIQPQEQETIILSELKDRSSSTDILTDEPAGGTGSFFSDSMVSGITESGPIAMPKESRSTPARGDDGRPAVDPQASTILIPRLEQEEQALRDAQAGLEEYEGYQRQKAEGNPDDQDQQPDSDDTAERGLRQRSSHRQQETPEA
uniref:phosphotransferase n=1 Tax=Bifidobacterium aemilianum TaxID=2493120 RepID=UPI001F36142A|nr:phosphotransferase [Bifidobacterium aemilianum]